MQDFVHSIQFRNVSLCVIVHKVLQERHCWGDNTSWEDEGILSNSKISKSSGNLQSSTNCPSESTGCLSLCLRLTTRQPVSFNVRNSSLLQMLTDNKTQKFPWQFRKTFQQHAAEAIVLFCHDANQFDRNFCDFWFYVMVVFQWEGRSVSQVSHICMVNLVVSKKLFTSLGTVDSYVAALFPNSWVMAQIFCTLVSSCTLASPKNNT